MVQLGRILKYGKKAIYTLVLAQMIYLWGFLMGTSSLSTLFSQKIKNQSGLELILQRERKKLDIPDKIYINVNWGAKSAKARKIGENEYEIDLKKEYQNVSILKHELYHIKDGHLDHKTSLIRYLFYEEPQATLYQVTGIKL